MPAPTPQGSQATPAALSQLCEKCSVLSFNDACFGDEEEGVFKPEQRRILQLDYDQRDTLPNLPALGASAAAGCAFCAALREATLGLQLGGHSDISYQLRLSWGIRDEDFAHVGLYLLEATVFIEFEHDIDRRSMTRTIIFYVDSEDEACRDWLRLLPSPNTYALSESNVDTVKAALSYCEHECGCDPLRTPGFRPTRLLDLGAWESSDSIKLVETSSLTSVTAIRYAALSYCWGSKTEAASQLRTTAATLESYLDRIYADLSTPVIRDAVEATRALSLRYLWIDALCIIQENHQDWTRESERMDLVYINAYCTICTLASSTCLKGFLERKAPVAIGFGSAIRPDIIGRFNLRHLPRPDYGHDFDPFYVEREVGAWRSRGWTYQEEYLSARKVLFGHSRMFYSCPKREWTEPSFYQSTASCHTLADILRVYQANGDLEYLYSSWLELLQNYTRRQLTKSGDVLPAISGLAKRLAQSTGDEYLAGMWRSDLVRQLLWESYRQHHATLPEFLDTCLSYERTGHNYVCPNWSCIWLAGTSCHQAATYDNFASPNSGFRPEAKILDVHTVPEEPVLNPWGRIKNAHLEIEGKYNVLYGVLWAKIYSNGEIYSVNLDADDETQVVVCILDFAPISLQELHTHNLVMLLMASSTSVGMYSSWMPGGGSVHNSENRGSSNQPSDCGSAQSLDSPSSADESERMDVNEMDIDYDIEDSNASVEEDQGASEACSISEERGQEITDDVISDDAATHTSTSSTTHTDNDMEEEESEEESEEDEVEELARTAWGLLLYRLPDGRYIRLGVFSSSPKQGGLAIFEDCQTQSFNIV